MPAVVAMTVNMLRRVPARGEHSLVQRLFDFFWTGSRSDDYRQARLTRVVLYEATFTSGGRMAVCWNGAAIRMPA
jgi:hypothetical protein